MTLSVENNNWYYSPEHGELCRVIETQTLWGETVCRVWLPGKDAVVQLPATRLRPPHEAGVATVDGIAYLAAAARVADALTQDVLLAPIESSVIPLPHQIRALSRAISNDRVRYLLADEVGLGKTIEAGLIMRELKLRGLVRRTLVIAPKGLVTQWVAEMRAHFNEHFQLVLPDDIKTLSRISAVASPESRVSGQEDSQPVTRNSWTLFPQVVVPMDSVKPLDKRRGWSREQVAEYNRERFEDLISAGWDLVIVDEAHRLGGSTDQVARYKLGQGLAEAAPYLLLLSATPHQGKTDAFHRLISLVDAKAFPDVSSVTKERVQPYVIRTEKRRAIDAEGKPLFNPRRTELAPVSWKERHWDQRLLYEAVTEYVREGYNQAIAEKRSYIGFLMILMQRLVVSSTRAIRTTLERRLEALEAPQEQLTLFPMVSEEDWADLDGQEQMDTLLKTRLKALKNERAEVKLLLEAAKRCESQGPDAKAEALLDWIYRLQAEEGDPDLKVLVFTEFVPTQEMLMRFLTERGITVVCLNGSMDLEERKRVQDAFAKDVRILISTDAGGEGLNLQFCHVVINYDIPWNPMRLEQRIGRVDRIGQTHTVRAINFVFEDSVEHRVREVLEEKLAVIFEEFGIDKTGDVLDSAQAGRMFDEMYVEAILNPEKVEESVESVVARLQEQAREARTTASVLGATEDLEPGEAQRLLAHPLPHWVERMTVSYLQAHGGKAERKNGAWDLTWPNGERLTNVVFTSKEAEEKPLSRHLTLEDPKVRGLAMRLPPFTPGQPVPVITLPGLAPEIMGFWSLWQISVTSHESRVASRPDGLVTLDPGPETRRRRIMPLFLADDGRVFAPTARHIWDQLLTTPPTILWHLDIETSHQAFDQLRGAAERQGKTIYDELVQAHRERLAREREKGEYAFAARRRAIERIGLPQVRNHRLSLLEQEEERFREQLERRAQILPEMAPLALVRVEGGVHG
ncbi:helicase domain protein [Thermanaerovibrio acidaminovorans DSM 6589]|uniref:Helicase domain protein n=1 Tax=Thermanaerovibrio acidaminovorans (strain ATCC 49978 / DSM 6589 / Su883) TaxID=525903 RepID=D1B6S6_THEAS|nr:helicase-related protein [Thermanaerovibrio acidaminovorans]ACZ19717.1 helicase domain protein [Thermanaerovibrio acidaminovorans DSM 6589]